jgi:hypothetical protein
MTLTRRGIFRLTAGTGFAAVAAFGASDFWNKKPPSDWSEQEIDQLMSRSPWAKDVNADFEDDTSVETGARLPSVDQNGMASPAPGTARPNPPQVEFGGTPRDTRGGAKRRQPVTIRWESAQPILDATGRPTPKDFAGRYVISVSGLPIGVMDRHRGRGGPATGPAMVEDGGTNPRARMIEQLRASATLVARGKEPEQPGIVASAPAAPGTYLFGFSKELLPLDGDDREIVFTLQTGFIALKAKFEPKEMRYRGHLAI